MYSDSTMTPRKAADHELSRLWELFTKVRGSVSCKLVEATVLSASQAHNAEITAATLPPMAADLDLHAFREYLGKWLKKNEERGTPTEAMLSAFRRARQQFATHVRWEFEVQKRKFMPFDEATSIDLERRYVDGMGECVLEAGGETYEVDLDSMVMYSEKAEVRMKRRVTVVQATVGDAFASHTHRVERDLPCNSTAVSWTYRPHGANWQHFGRFQAFAIERAFRELGMPDEFPINVGGASHTIVTVDTVLDETTGRRRGPHIRRTDADADGSKFSLIRRVLVPRDHSHSSDVHWRRECPVLYAALAMQEQRPNFARCFGEFEASGEITLKPDSLDDDDDTMYALLRELIDRWGIPPAAIRVPGDLQRYEALVEGMWVPMLPLNNWLMQPTTSLSDPQPTTDTPSCTRVVYLFRQWLPYDLVTGTVRLPEGMLGSDAREGQSPADGHATLPILWCRVVEDRESIVRFLLKGKTPWVCSRELLSVHSMFPRRFIEPNQVICDDSITAAEATEAIKWALSGSKGDTTQYSPNFATAAMFFGFDRQLAAR